MPVKSSVVDVSRRAAAVASCTRQDSFDRPDSPLFHETLPLPAESAIRRHRQRSRGPHAAPRSDTTSSDSDGQQQQQSAAVPRRPPRRRQQRRRRAASAGAKSARRRGRPSASQRFVQQLDLLHVDYLLYAVLLYNELQCQQHIHSRSIKNIGV